MVEVMILICFIIRLRKNVNPWFTMPSTRDQGDVEAAAQETEQEQQERQRKLGTVVPKVE